MRARFDERAFFRPDKETETWYQHCLTRLHKVKSSIRSSHTFTHDTKAVVDGHRVVFRTIAGYAKGNADVMMALANLFRRPVSHVVLLPAASVLDDVDNADWEHALTLDVGDQVVDEFGRAYEIQGTSVRNFDLRQLTSTH
jgi:hypothetical protein